MERPFPGRLNPVLARLELGDRIGDGRGGRGPASRPEIVAPAFQAERALEPAELTERVAQGLGVLGAERTSAAPPAQRGVPDAARRRRDLRVPPIRLTPEQLDQAPVLGGGAGGLPDPRRPAL